MTSPKTEVRAPEDASESPYSEAGLAYTPSPRRTHYLQGTCALTESLHTLLPRAYVRSYRERKWALGKSADPLPKPAIQKVLLIWRRGRSRHY